MDTPAIRQAAAEGLEASSRWRLKFWRRSEINAAEAASALDRVESLSGGNLPAVTLGRVAAGAVESPRARLKAMREALSIVEVGACGGLAGMAVRVMNAAGTSTAAPLMDSVVSIAHQQAATETALYTALQMVGAAGIGAAWALQQADAAKDSSAAGFAAQCAKVPDNSLDAAVRGLQQWPNTVDLVARYDALVALPVDGKTRAAVGHATMDAAARGERVTPEGDAALAIAWMKDRSAAEADALAAWGIGRMAAGGTDARAWSALRAAVQGTLPDDGARRRFDLDVLQSARETMTVCGVAKRIATALGEANGDVALVHALRGAVADPVFSSAMEMLEMMSAAGAISPRAALKWIGDRENITQDNLASIASVALLDSDAAGRAAVSFFEARAAAENNPWRSAQVGLIKLSAGAAGNSVEILRDGLAALGDASVADAQGLAAVGLRLARAADTVGARSRIARGALEQCAALEPKCVKDLQTLAAVEDDAMKSSPNRAWFRASVALKALSCLKSGHATLGEASREFLALPWASPSYMEALALASCTVAKQRAFDTNDLLVSSLADKGISDLSRPLEPASAENPMGDAAKRVARVFQVMDELAHAERGIFGRGARQGPSDLKIEDADEFVEIGGVKVPKVGGSLPAAVPSAAPIAQAEPPPPPALLTALPVESSPGADQKIEIKMDSSYKSGITGAYNPLTGKSEWNSSYKSGISAVFNPALGKIEFHESYKSGVSGVYDPRRAEVEWRESYHTGIAGAYNPLTGKSEWTESYHSGCGAIFNPFSGTVQTTESYHTGVAGHVDTRSGEVKWESSYHSGVGIVSNDPECPSLSGASYPGYRDDD